MRKTIMTLLASAALAVGIAGTAAPASARDWDRGDGYNGRHYDRGWDRDHGRRYDRDWDRGYHRGYYRDHWRGRYYRPYYSGYYAPAPAYYAPSYYAPSYYPAPYYGGGYGVSYSSPGFGVYIGR